MSEDEKSNLVIDNGGCNIKSGFSGDDAPKCYTPTLIGYPRTDAEPVVGSVEVKGHYIGEEAWNKRGVLDLTCPIQHGHVSDWDAMELIWEHTIKNDLRVVLGGDDYQEDDEDIAGALLTEPPPNTTAPREKMCEVWFEKMHARRYYVASTPVLSLYSSGRTTGVVVEAGVDTTRTVPIYEGYALPHAIQRLDIGGRDLDGFLCHLLTDSGIHLTTAAERPIAENIKQCLCYVASDFKLELAGFGQRLAFAMASHPRLGASSLARHLPHHLMHKICSDLPCDRSYELPDGSVMSIGSEMIRCPEAMFTPSTAGGYFSAQTVRYDAQTVQQWGLPGMGVSFQWFMQHLSQCFFVGAKFVTE